MMKLSVRWMSYAGSLGLLVLLGAFLSGCSGTNGSALSGPPVYVLSVTSIASLHDQITAISPADNNGVASGTTGLSLVYSPGTTVTVTAAASDSTGPFIAWCDASSASSSPFVCAPPPCDSVSGLTCTVKMTASKNLLATYPGVTSVTVTPISPTAVVPATTQFTATVHGVGTYVDSNGKTQNYDGSPYSFSLTGPSGFNTSLGTISATGLYTPPYPIPATVTLRTASVANPSAATYVTITLNAPATTTGPALSVDVGSPTHVISPNIYGMDDYGLNPVVPAEVNLPVERWGGNSTTRYNYLVDATNSASDYYFENNYPTTTGYPVASRFNSQVTQDEKTLTNTLATVPLIGYTTLRKSACSYSVAKYGAQTVTDPANADCGTGILTTPVNGSTTIVNDPTDTSMPIDETFVSGWVNFLVGQFGTAAHGGVALYGLDNEPEYWNGVHKDVHPNPFTYDELSNKGITYAAAIKAQDPSALVTGPVISNWMNYFYSAQDVANGYNHNPSCQNANPTDRLAHGNIPLIEYYLQQFQKYETTNGKRLLDYVDLHTYFAAPGAAFALTGDTTLQQARLNSTRVFWDPTYTDPAYTDPNNNTCTGAAYPPNLINLMKGWVAKDYPGTKLAITEYNWGGQEAINGALAQADILGIFGREGLDLATLWGPPDPSPADTSKPSQKPGLVGFQVYTNYDGKNAHFGETAITSTSSDQGVLAVYGATRAADSTVTIVVINKSYGDLTSTLSLANLKPNGNAKAYLYNEANITGISAQPDVTVTPPTGTSTTSTLSTLFPAQSITILVVPKL
ncbi:glycoside hydrolase family 44 protein [Granulicella aggregans]|uniref:glycoside hydrolase family 44 protein n=1 Tax=Granulicella aggregans TaxID=474949 RepID=UPI0021E0B850|nr:glycoside hydrolase family 44 protein [Granulicella aggregans]